MTSHKMLGVIANRLQLGPFSNADWLLIRTPRMKPATRWWIRRVGDIAAEQRLFLSSFWIGDRYRGEQRLRIRMFAPPVHVFRRHDLDDLPKIHYGNSIAHVFHN